MSARSRLIESADAAGKESALMPNRTLAIDLHAHALIPEVEALVHGQEGLRRDQEAHADWATKESNDHNRTLFATTYMPKLTQLDQRIAAMDAMGIDMQAVSIVPQYNYWADRDLAEKIVSTANEGIAAICRARPDRFAGLGTVSLQHPDLAVAQLDHAVKTLHLKGIIVCTAVNDLELADPSLEPVWSKVEELDALVFMHPAGCSLGARIAPYYLSNVIGNPADTTIALAKLVFGGVLDRHPRLKICGAHGGGYFPFYIGRFDHGWRVRPEAKTCRLPPSEYLKRLWFDALVFDPEQLAYLIRRAGPSQVVLGTDFPFDMGIDDPIARLNAAPGLSEADRAAVRGGNAARLLNL
jgi:predicted TIM-barrel fold metal-dependent hydrolase